MDPKIRYPLIFGNSQLKGREELRVGRHAHRKAPASPGRAPPKQPEDPATPFSKQIY